MPERDLTNIFNVRSRHHPLSVIIGKYAGLMIRDWRGDVFADVWQWFCANAAIGPASRRGKKFGKFGQGSIILFPTTTIFNEEFIHIGNSTMIGSHVALSAGMMPGQECLTNPVIRIGDRCLIGRGSGIVGHLSIDIGDDVWTGHHVYITDQSHGYEDITIPISRQTQPERAVSIGEGSWLGHGVVVLPGARIGKHVAVGANSVVTNILPDYCVAVGSPAKIIRQYHESDGWTPAKEIPREKL